MTSTCINPFVYAIMHVSFRDDCRRIWWNAKRIVLRRPEHPRNLSTCTSFASMYAGNVGGVGAGFVHNPHGSIRSTTSLRQTITNSPQLFAKISSPDRAPPTGGGLKRSVSLIKRHTSAEYLSLTPVRSASPVQLQTAQSEQDPAAVRWVSATPSFLASTTTEGDGVKNGVKQHPRLRQLTAVATPLFRGTGSVGDVHCHSAVRRTFTTTIIPPQGVAAWGNAPVCAYDGRAAEASEVDPDVALLKQTLVVKPPSPLSSPANVASSSRTSLRDRCLAVLEAKRPREKTPTTATRECVC